LIKRQTSGSAWTRELQDVTPDFYPLNEEAGAKDLLGRKLTLFKLSRAGDYRDSGITFASRDTSKWNDGVRARLSTLWTPYRADGGMLCTLDS
jgi:hypothetical protein